MIWASLAPGSRAGGWGISGVIRVSLYEFRMFRGKELSQLVQDLLTVSNLGSYSSRGGGRWVWGYLGHGGSNVHHV